MDIGSLIAERYLVKAAIGRGGMGQVWLAQDKSLERSVALKTMIQGVSPDPGRAALEVKRFEREAMAVARLDHIGLAAVYDMGEDGGVHFLAMQYVQGLDLADLIAENERLTVQQAASVAVQICSVLATAHAQQIVHRDLKPGNVRVRTDGVVKVLDFGAAALLDAAEPRLTNPGSTAPGTWQYMAPEQIAGQRVTQQTDLYALGCLLHEMLSGKAPFRHSSPLMIPEMHLSEEPSPLSLLEPTVPSPVEELVLELLAKDPGHRPAHAGEVYRRLADFLPNPLPAERALAPWAEADPCRPFTHPMAPGARPVRSWAAG
ncbi:serine/threonine-protein kinase [Kitasatospora sp. NPDC096147]|uniref:serine/threonine-protein kinase n=1 Tax=Kitasatospora sp. NPDC096147 TaxID=3364093 RepID=UPI0038261578